MKKFDVVVIGYGSGAEVAAGCADAGLKVAIVEEGPLGGTCLNRGCIPSKMLIHSADVAETIANSKKFGIESKITKINFSKIVGRVSKLIDEDARAVERGVRATKNMTLFKMRGKFVGRRTLKVGNEIIYGEKVVVAAGARPAIPPIPGLEGSGFMTSDEALRLRRQPRRMVIVGGGFIGAELAHFFGALGTEVSIVESMPTLMAAEDDEVARKFTELFARKHDVITNAKVVRVERKGAAKIVHVQMKEGGKMKKLEGDALLVAVGRRPNSDLIDAKAGGIEMNPRGFVKVNEYLETSAENVWALGDIVGNYMFKHSANWEAEHCLHNLLHPEGKRKVDYSAMPHAAFTSPQVAGVGYAESELKMRGIDYAAGRYEYRNTGMGAAMREEDGFVKILVEKPSGRILGCYIMGPEASTLIHEVVVAMRSGEGKVGNITNAVHAHPALSEVVQRACWNLE